MKLCRLLAGKSLRLRLCAFFTLLVAVAWLSATGLAWFESRDYIDEFFDTQQMLFARQLAAINHAGHPLPSELPSTDSLLYDDDEEGDVDDDALGFAVFDRTGRMILHDGEKGARFLFTPGARGFTNSRIRDSKKYWRIVWLPATNGQYIVAVGQELQHRQEMAFELLWRQLAPWVFCLPLLLGGMVWLVSRELVPLRRITHTVERRTPDDATSLDEQGIPPEVRPLVTALNNLFLRVTTLLARERSFIADAAHELRTPLAALRVQAEVAQLAADDPVVQSNALANLTEGIDRASRLVKQLLVLSRLDSVNTAGLSALGIDWQEMIDAAVAQHAGIAAEKGLSLTVECTGLPFQNSRNKAAAHGQVLPDPESCPPQCRTLEQGPQNQHSGCARNEDSAALVELLLRNLLDNAIRYTPEGGSIQITMDSCGVGIANSGTGVASELLPRLGERFFRPPGQEQRGSGLGLSIARRIAELHGLSLSYGNQEQGGFVVKIEVC